MNETDLGTFITMLDKGKVRWTRFHLPDEQQLIDVTCYHLGAVDVITVGAGIWSFDADGSFLGIKNR